MNPFFGFAKRIRSSSAAAILTALAGAAAFLVQSSVYLYQLPSTLDEGNYLYKGYLFATGVLKPYQDYGVWTNKMPFAFLIPGWAQALLGPGIRTGRYFAVFLGLLMVLGIWILARRLGGKWWAAGAVLAISLNPGLIRMLDQALSEGLVVCLLVWTLVFILSDKKSTWRIIAGSILASVTFLTRENMAPILFILPGFVWSHHGRRSAFLSAAVIAAVVIIVHAVFWPNILILWAARIPENISPFLNPFRPYLGSEGVWAPNLDILSRVYSFWLGMRYHFVPLAGTAVALVFWPKKENWPSAFFFRSAVTLVVLMMVLTLIHIYGSLITSYCTFCFPLYLAFFSPIGLLVVAAVFPHLTARLPLWRDIPALLLTLIFATGIGFGAYQDLDDALLNLPVPRIRDLQLQGGTTDLWRLLSNKFQLSFDQLKMIVPTTAGLVAGIILLVIAFLVIQILKKKNPRAFSFGSISLMITFSLGALLTPSVVFGNVPEADCGGDVVASYEAAAPILREAVPPGSTIFWDGGLAPIPLLYMPGVKVFWPQLNDGYAVRTGGDPDVLLKFGYWNYELSDQWFHSADFLLIEDWRYKKGYNEMIKPEEFEQIAHTPVILTCRDQASIRVFRRIP